MSEAVKEFQSFKEFYPFYLSEHSNRTCRTLHYGGSLSVLAFLGYCLFTQQYSLLPFLLLEAYK